MELTPMVGTRDLKTLRVYHDLLPQPLPDCCKYDASTRGDLVGMPAVLLVH